MVRARKRFAQHFLEPAWVAKLVTAIEPTKEDRIIEIGPGHGAITLPLSARVDRLLAIEVDRDLATALDARAVPNLTVVTADFLTVNLAEVAASFVSDGEAAHRRVRVVGNLPYNISSPILFRLIEAAPAVGLRDATLMLQEEVADRLVARPGTGEYGVLTLCTALGADVSRVLSLPPGAFRPAPKVRSAVVRLTFRPAPPEIDEPDLVVAVVRSVFTQRRKTMSNALAPFASARGMDARAALARAGIDPRRRPETLELLEFGRLAKELKATRAEHDQERPRG